MALIGKIRNNSWLLIVLLGLGLGGFILMDMMSGQQSVFGGNQTVMGSIDGDKLDWTRFSRVEQLLYQGSAAEVYTRRNALWNYFVEESLINREAEAIGLGISRRELQDLQFGANPSPIIQQRFIDPNTGLLSREQLNFFKQQIDNKTLEGPQRSVWAHQEKEIIKDGLQSKLNTLVSQALYTPTWMAEMGNEDQNSRVDFAYVMVPFSEIDNSDIALEDKDFKNYIKENSVRLAQEEETRKVAYAVFDVFPSSADSAKWEQSIADLVPKFETAENDSVFVQSNLGQISANYLSKPEVSSIIADSLATMVEGSVMGPYIDQGNYTAAKLLDRHLMSDSASTRHILINASTPAQFAEASKRIDSLQNVLATGAATFDSLAIKFSQDPGSSSNGGVYENITPNQFIPEFNQILFVTGEIGKLYKIRSTFGVHLVEVLRRSKEKTERYQLAYLTQPIVPSDETVNSKFDHVNALLEKPFYRQAKRSDK